jgi:hypothetical protein
MTSNPIPYKELLKPYSPSSTILSFCKERENKRGKRLAKGVSATQLANQKFMELPLPTFWTIEFGSQFLDTTTPSKVQISFHRVEEETGILRFLQSTKSTIKLPYFATRTSFQRGIPG